MDFMDGFLVVAVRQRLIYTKLDDLLDIESYAALGAEEAELHKQESSPTGRNNPKVKTIRL